MKLRNRASLSPSPLLSPPPPSRWAALLARMRTSAWAAVGVKVGAVVVALVVLGWIGRTAAAGASPASTTTPERSEADAGAPALTTVIAVDGGTPPTGPVPAPPAATAAAGSHGRASSTEPVFLNHASVDELRRLPGVGPKRAEAILVLRQRLGRFQRVEDLLRVKGIGRGAVKKWRPLVRLDTPEAGAP